MTRPPEVPDELYDLFEIRCIQVKVSTGDAMKQAIKLWLAENPTTLRKSKR